jgi:hypothetical protein
MAQYFTVNDANPWRDDIYVYRDKRGNIVYVDSYKILARWAKDDCPYDHKFTELEAKPDERHRIRCWIMRDDRKAAMREYVELGAPWNEAYELVAVFADGVVREAETQGRNKPPTGWTWEQRARTRAYKAALRLSHGAPTPKQLYESAMTVNGTRTLAEDWEHDAEELTPHEIERLAQLKAQVREHATAWEQLSAEEQQAKLKENTDLMRAPEDFEGYGDEPSPEAARAAFDAGAAAGAASRLAREDMEHDLAAEEVKLTHEQVAAGIEKIKATRRIEGTPPEGTQGAPAGQKRAKVQTAAWGQAAQGLVKEMDQYTTKDGHPNYQRMTEAAFAMGYPEIRDDNLQEVIEAVGLYAKDQQALAAAEAEELRENDEAGQQVLDL